MKSNYERPTAIPLGELIKGSGVCNPGSAVMPESGGCSTGTSPNIYNCTTGNFPEQACSTGISPNNFIIK